MWSYGMRADLENELFDQENTTDKSWKHPGIWQRGLAMLCFGFISGFIRLFITLIAIFQFITLLCTYKPNQQLLALGQSLNSYIFQINQFLTINSETYPFPFTQWPDGKTSRVPSSE
jgi:uncharacterized protein YdeI (YjbR/CyaY-like superfamily)